MSELKTNPMNHQPAPWLPSFDIHEENGELVLHADLEGFGSEDLEISLDGADLIVLAEGENRSGVPVCFSRLALPFAHCDLRMVSQRGHDDLEIHIPFPTEEEAEPESAL
ncbi:MAG TPA: Hsp20/alpha crystallin family protein [Thermoanaerobaculia bacterium]|nr:Hsp20/alpha crystallin family protein [Thermoanaerobaculia bacterium]